MWVVSVGQPSPRGSSPVRTQAASITVVPDDGGTACLFVGRLSLMQSPNFGDSRPIDKTRPAPTARALSLSGTEQEWATELSDEPFGQQRSENDGDPSANRRPNRPRGSSHTTSIIRATRSLPISARSAPGRRLPVSSSPDVGRPRPAR